MGGTDESGPGQDCPLTGLSRTDRYPGCGAKDPSSSDATAWGVAQSQAEEPPGERDRGSDTSATQGQERLCQLPAPHGPCGIKRAVLPNFKEKLNASIKKNVRQRCGGGEGGWSCVIYCLLISISGAALAASRQPHGARGPLHGGEQSPASGWRGGIKYKPHWGRHGREPGAGSGPSRQERSHQLPGLEVGQALPCG